MSLLNKKAPEFCLPNQDETEICLRDLSGKWIVIYFYPKDSTPGCTTEACDFSSLNDDFENMDTIVLGISPDGAKSHKNFIAKQNLTIMLLTDSEKNTLKAFNAWGMKKLYGKEYEGVIRSTFLVNPSGEIKAEWTKVKVKGHAQEVKEKLKELQAS